MLYFAVSRNNGNAAIIHNHRLACLVVGQRLFVKLADQGNGMYRIPQAMARIPKARLFVNLMDVSVPTNTDRIHLDDQKEGIASSTTATNPDKEPQSVCFITAGRVIYHRNGCYTQVCVSIQKTDPLLFQVVCVEERDVHLDRLDGWVKREVRALLAKEKARKSPTQERILGKKKSPTDEQKKRRADKQKRLALQGKDTRGAKDRGRGGRSH